jgi:hypothetical protein
MSVLGRARLAFVAVFALFTIACADPPEKEMQQAQGAIDAARAAGADRYAHDQFTAAQDLLKQAHDAVDQRDYRLALNYALDSRERAQDAAKAAADNKAVARTDAEHALTAANAALNAARAKLKAGEPARAPRKTVAEARQTIADAEDAVQKARTAFDQTDYLAVTSALSGTTERLRAATHDLEASPSPATRRRR